jgi:threonine dehydratase
VRVPQPYAAAMQERDQLTGQTVGLALSGGNVDSAMFASVLQTQ